MKRRLLQFSDQVSLPVDAVTQTFGILAVRRAGKSNAAVRLAEEMYEAGLPFVAIDPKGDWWGLRSSGNGKKKGLSIPIFGGDHGDVPLERAGGAFVADLIASQRLSCVVDVSEFSDSDKTRFLTDFAERLYRKNRHPLHLFLDEADDYIPQTPYRDQARCVGAWKKLVKQGGFKGIGCTLITQRSASLAKSVLTQIETLILLRTTSPQDQLAIKAWIKENGLADTVLASLSGLKDGQAWVWSPHFLRLTEPKLVQFQRRWTFDSGATPKVGERKRKPTTLADVDLGAIKSKMAATIERAKEEDPRELRTRIAELTRELAEERKKKVAPAPAAPVQAPTKRVEIPILSPKLAARLSRISSAIEKEAGSMGTVARMVLDGLAKWQNRPTPGIGMRPGEMAAFAGPHHVEKAVPAAPHNGRAAPPPPSTGNSTSRLSADTDIKLKAGARRMLAVLKRYGRLTKPELSLVSWVSGGSFGQYVAALTRAGLIGDGGTGRLGLTRDGELQVSEAAPALNHRQLIEEWMTRAKLKSGARRMLDLLLQNPRGVGLDNLGTMAGVSGGSRGQYVAKLKRLGLIEKNGDLVVLVDMPVEARR